MRVGPPPPLTESYKSYVTVERGGERAEDGWMESLMAPCYAEEEEVGQSCWMVVARTRSVCSLVLQQPPSHLHQASVEAAVLKGFLLVKC